MNSAAVKKTFYCDECEARMHRMQSRCPQCGQWNTIKEGVPDTMSTVVVRMSDIDPETTHKISTGMPELDEVLDGGVIRGQVILLAAPPGGGKSTLMLEVADALSKRGVLDIDRGKENRKKKNEVLYNTSEEDIEKIKARSLRIDRGHNILVCHNKTLADIESDFAEHQPEFGIIDSLSRLSGSDSVQGAVNNLGRLYDFAHSTHTTLFVIAHVNKNEELAGAVALEHCVDTVLMLSRDREESNVRVLRVQKNRHGDESHIGLFEMTEKGIYAFDPTEGIDGKNIAPGQTFGVANLGGKSLLVEVQALVTPSAKPTINSIGYEASRVRMILAVLRERAGVSVGDCDIFVSVLGGINFADPGLDAAVAMAIASAQRKEKLRPMAAYAGEVDLLGKIKVGKNRKEIAEKYGFKLVSGESLEDLLGS